MGSRALGAIGSRAIGIGIFGYGFMASAHLDAMQAIARETRLQPLAVCGPRRSAAEAFAARYGLSHACTDPRELLEYPGIDAVIIASPDDTHCDLAVAAARAGKHILCEKPLALNRAQAQQIVDAVKAVNVRGMTGFLLRYAPAVQVLAAEIARGGLGTVQVVHAQRYDAELLDDSAAMSWRYDPARVGSGVLGDLGSHMIDLALLFGGNIAEVSADLCTFVLDFPDAGEVQRGRATIEALLPVALEVEVIGLLYEPPQELDSPHTTWSIEGHLRLVRVGIRHAVRPQEPGEVTPDNIRAVVHEARSLKRLA